MECNSSAPCEIPDLWKLLLAAAEPGAEKPSAEAVRAAVGVDRGAAARPFATPAGWEPVKGALVRLRPGLGEKEGLRAGDGAA